MLREQAALFWGRGCRQSGSSSTLGSNWPGPGAVRQSGGDTCAGVTRSQVNFLHSPSTFYPATTVPSTPPLPAMARTKQTARNSTGGAAKRQPLAPSSRVLHSHSQGTPHPPQPTPDSDMADILPPGSVGYSEEEPGQTAGMAEIPNVDADEVSKLQPEIHESLT